MESPVDKPKKKPTKIEEMTKEQIRQAIQKKRESNAKAQTIVENLLEQNISESYFLECLPDINQSHFEDVVEERSITHVCGYPLCDKPISKTDIPKQKYRISVKTNKVYDITGRKNFCSNLCYNSAMYVKKQMLTSPLWYREYEKIPVFHLMSTDSGSNVSYCMGQEIDVSIIEKVEVTEPPKFTSINDFAQASLNQMVGEDETKEDVNSKQDGDSNKVKELTSDSFLKPEVKELQTIKPEEIKAKAANPFSIIGEIVERSESKVDPILINKPGEIKEKLKKKIQQKKQPSLSTITIEVEKCLAEWFTLDTMLFLLGEEKVREMVTDKSDCIKEYMNNYSKSIFHNANSYDQYLMLCRKLNMLEMEDKKLDCKEVRRETKPLPDYSMIQEDGKRMQLKVKAYLDGNMEVPEPLSAPHEAKTNEDKELTQLPLVDKNAQNALRRRIVYQHLNKVLPDLLSSLGLVALSVNADAKVLVNTFKLSANNIMFKPLQWTLISIIILKLLSLRDKHLEYRLEEPTAFQHMHLLLLSFKLDGGYVDRLIYWLTDIDRLLDTNDRQMTIE